MSVKLTENGMWESSRMMLPEHKEAINYHQQEQQRRPKVDLDEQELEQISRALQQSIHYKVPLSIKMYDPFESLHIIGVVNNISTRYGQFRVGDDWFNLNDIEFLSSEDIEIC